MSGRRGRKPKSQAEQEYNRWLGKRIEVARKRAGIQAKDFARSIGVSGSQLYWYETGRSQPRFLMMTRIAHRLEIPLAELLEKR